ncbi:MAG: hypothetical protein J5I41_09185 [Saprospiraceae bacterium]|nr:hypothetical protein [Saprospiraceae bacterium]
MWPDRKQREDLVVIRTARTEEAIGAAIEEGFWPLVKPVKPTAGIRSKYCVYQHKTTGRVQVVGDFRVEQWMDKATWQCVIPWTTYYPYTFPSPFAAYLIPPGLPVGEWVWLEDLIEDLPDTSWNQGDTTRLAAAEAIWNGTDFDILYDPESEKRHIIG